MSFRRNSFGRRSSSSSRQPQTRMQHASSNADLTARQVSHSQPNIIPELTKIVRKLLPKELPFNTHVHDVEYLENGSERLTGTLYLTTFRLVFAPDNELENNSLITSSNKYIGEYDIPLTSILKINVGPGDNQSGFTSYLTESQSRSEPRTFSLLTRDFRYLTFTKCAVTKVGSLGSKLSQIPTTRMETYIEALKDQTRPQKKEHLYPYLALYTDTVRSVSPRGRRSDSLSAAGNGRSIEDDIGDFSLSSDDRIRSYLTSADWKAELAEANEVEWVVDRDKFSRNDTVRSEGPYVCMANSNNNDSIQDRIWHWTHTSEVSNDYRGRQMPRQQYMLITVLGVNEVTTSVDPLRRVTTDTGLVSSTHFTYEQPSQRFSLTKFPCTLQQLQTSFKKLIEICVMERDENDEKWWTKLHSCKWLKYVSKTLHCAASMGKLLDYRTIELAGADTDMSCLMSSLIQILLRPKCRTIKGFCELIVREWLIRGHRFRERFGQVLCDTSGYPAQEAPVFLLFLDCVHQLLVQNPFAFEFTTYLLIELYHSVCYCYHHTFAFNHVLERIEIISNLPRDLLFLSAFDFSLYIHSEAYRLLRNEASVFHQYPPSSPSMDSSTTKRPVANVTNLKSKDRPTAAGPNGTRTVYRLESPKPLPRPSTIPMTTTTTTTNGSARLNPDQYEYDYIESPQIFPSSLHVDWRTFNLELWSQCYCRYDRNNLPTTYEKQLWTDVSYLKEDVAKVRSRFKENMTIDTHHSTMFANSWHPQTLNTRF